MRRARLQLALLETQVARELRTRAQQDSSCLVEHFSDGANLASQGTAASLRAFGCSPATVDYTLGHRLELAQRDVELDVLASATINANLGAEPMSRGTPRFGLWTVLIREYRESDRPWAKAFMSDSSAAVSKPDAASCWTCSNLEPRISTAGEFGNPPRDKIDLSAAEELSNG